MRIVVIRVDTSAPEVNRRSVYLQMRRKMPVTVLETFDLPVMDPNCEVRASSTVAPQALFLMNDDFVVRTARVLAERVRKELPGQMREQVGLLWRLVFGVDPRADEVDRFLVGLSEQSEQIRERVAKMPVGKEVVQPDAGLEAMASLCQVLLSSNRFLYLE